MTARVIAPILLCCLALALRDARAQQPKYDEPSSWDIEGEYEVKLDYRKNFALITGIEMISSVSIRSFNYAGLIDQTTGSQFLSKGSYLANTNSTRGAAVGGRSLILSVAKPGYASTSCSDAI
jgi:hypothetical protein